MIGRQLSVASEAEWISAVDELRSRNTTDVQDKRLYTLDVFLIGGPMADEFVEQNPVVSRTLEIRADQTLAELHVAIFKAFDREEQHLYEFQVGGQGPQDPNANCYVALQDAMGWLDYHLHEFRLRRPPKRRSIA